MQSFFDRFSRKDLFVYGFGYLFIGIYLLWIMFHRPNFWEDTSTINVGFEALDSFFIIFGLAFIRAGIKREPAQIKRTPT